MNTTTNAKTKLAIVPPLNPLAALTELELRTRRLDAAEDFDALEPLEAEIDRRILEDEARDRELVELERIEATSESAADIRAALHRMIDLKAESRARRNHVTAAIAQVDAERDRREAERARIEREALVSTVADLTTEWVDKAIELAALRVRVVAAAQRASMAGGRLCPTELQLKDAAEALKAAAENGTNRRAAVLAELVPSRRRVVVSPTALSSPALTPITRLEAFALVGLDLTTMLIDPMGGSARTVFEAALRSAGLIRPGMAASTGQLGPNGKPIPGEADAIFAAKWSELVDAMAKANVCFHAGEN